MRTLKSSTILLGLLVVLMSVGCGPEEGENQANGGENQETTENQNSNGDEIPAGWEYLEYSGVVEVRPDGDGMTGNDAVEDLSAVEVAFEATVGYRPEEGSDEFAGISTATVQIGGGDAEDGEDESFDFVELTYQGDGVYTGSVTGYRPFYRLVVDSEETGRRVFTAEAPTIHVITAPIDGESYSASEPLAVTWDPIESGVVANLLLDDELLVRANSTSDQQEAEIGRGFLESGTSPKVTVRRMGGELSFTPNVSAGGLAIDIYRDVTVNF